MEDPPKSMSIVLPRSTKKLDFLRETIVNFLNSQHIGEGTISQIELSVYEAVVNIIEHSSSDYIKEKINVECIVSKNEILITISNYGDMFDVTKVKLPDIDLHYKSGKMRGLGIYFIRTLMDKVEYTHHNMISTLTMVKKVEK